MFDKAKALYELKKIQSALAKEVVEVESGNGAVKIKISGDMKVQSIAIDGSLLTPENGEKLEKWLESAVNQAIKRSQMVMADKMKSVSGGLGIPGL